MDFCNSSDAYMIDRLTHAGLNGIERACLDTTEPAEIVSAAFNILDRTLSALARYLPVEERAENCQEIAAALNELLLTYGKLPN